MITRRLCTRLKDQIQKASQYKSIFLMFERSRSMEQGLCKIQKASPIKNYET